MFTTTNGRSELAREKLEGAVFFQDARGVVDDLREHARSYRFFWVSWAIFQPPPNALISPTLALNC